MKNVSVFLGSRDGHSPKIIEATEELGVQLAEQKLRLVYGGGRVGLMGRLADTVLAHGGEVVGVIPSFLFSKEVAHTGLTELHEVKSMHERKALMEKISQGFIALPGGFGTLDEVCEIITWNQIGIHEKPVGFLNPEGFFNHFFTFIQEAVGGGFIPEEHYSRIIIEQNAAELARKIKDWPL